jgi:hypothetical protein
VIDSDLSHYFADHGLACTASGREFLGNLDAPDQAIAMGGTNMLSTMYELTIATSDVQGLGAGSGLTVDGQAYTVRAVIAQDDGRVSVLTLSKD